LRPLGVHEPVEHVVGDVTNAASVARAVAGCDAVLHAAAVYDLDARARRAIVCTNAAGAELVLRAAAEHGCDPIVHVSSVVALLRRHATATPDSALSGVTSCYARSKVESEAVARRLQAGGAPVVIVQPGGVLGPHDPHRSDQVRRFRDILHGRYPLWPTGGSHIVDVRNVAEVHAAVMTPGGGPRRYLVPGHHVDGTTMFATLRAVTGRRLRHLIVPAAALVPAAWVASGVQHVLPFHLPFEYEGALISGYGTRCDDSRARQELGVRPRPLAETYADTVRWMHETGQLTDGQAGRAILQSTPIKV
jgi:nucleoside-diphosphate-sugar epimerase